MAVCWTKHATVSWHPCCAAVPVPPPPEPPDRCDGHNGAGMSSSVSGTRTASRRLIIPNKAVSEWKQSCRQPPKARCDSVSPSMPMLFDCLVMEQCKRYRPEGEGMQPLAPPRSNCQLGGSNSSGSFMPAEVFHHRQLHLRQRSGGWNRRRPR